MEKKCRLQLWTICLLKIISLVFFSCKLEPGTGVFETHPIGEVTVIASRTAGVAPLAVHFEVESTSEEFHARDFTWDFGDSDAGYWGTNDKPKNSAKGAVTAHVFETPGTYTVTVIVRDGSGGLGTATAQIIVDDPDVVYAGDRTTCVNPSGDTEFGEAPAGSRKISTNNLSTITQYATAGSRILFKRGSSWTTPDITNWPQNAGPVTIGAYGTGTNPDAFGIFENAPSITVTGEAFLHLDSKQNWRIMDLAFKDPARLHNSITGVTRMERQLFLRLKATGFKTGMGWGHWNDAAGPQIDQMAVVSCELSDAGENVMYAGSERLALMGNKIENAHTSHVARIWQAYKGVISNNIISGSSLSSDTGRMALKLHGANAQELASDGWDHLGSQTSYTILSDNSFGSSGPWPVAIGPTDDGTDCRMTNLIFERNRYCGDYGIRSSLSLPLTVSLRLHASQSSIRNNIFDASNFGNEITGIYIVGSGIATPPSVDVWIYNNTIYKTGNPGGGVWEGINIGAGVENSIIRNNIVAFPYTSSGHYLVRDLGTGTIQSNNLLNGKIGFTDPNNTDSPLLRSFSLTAGSSSAIAKGYLIASIFEDFMGNIRPSGTSKDIGAYVYTSY